MFKSIQNLFTSISLVCLFASSIFAHVNVTSKYYFDEYELVTPNGAGIISGPPAICVGETAQLITNGDNGGSWISLNPAVASIDNTGKVTGLTAGSATIQYVIGGDIASFSLTVKPRPDSPEVTNYIQSLCTPAKISDLEPSAANIYWYSSVTNVIPLPLNSNLISGEKYYVSQVVNGCESKRDSAIAVVHSAPTLSVIKENPVCHGESTGEIFVAASGNMPMTYVWSPNVSDSSTAQNLPVGTYSVTVIDNNSCSQNIVVNITEPSELMVSTSTTPANCNQSNGTATVNATGGGGSYTYVWIPTNLTSPTIIGLSGGSYDVTVTDDKGCSKTVTALVASEDTPVVTITSSQDVTCHGANDGSANISVTGGMPAYTYEWLPSLITTANVNNFSPGIHTITVTDNNGCKGSASVTISQPDQLQSHPVVISSVCGTISGSIELNVTGGTPNYTYQWNPNISNTATIGPIGGGDYHVIIKDAKNCILDTIIAVSVIGSFSTEISATPNEINISDIPVTTPLLSVETDTNFNVVSYQWFPTDGLSCTDCPNPIASPDHSTQYILVVTASDGCKGTDTIQINLVETCREIFVPNIFSPNRDGENDEFQVFGSCISKFELNIFDRWGMMIFQSFDQDNHWDGKVNGSDVNTGTYAYQVRIITTYGEEIEKSGTFTLVR
ncbi:MAG: gliding motility-associated C-terminal domain-containing protein [Brumimicrobium sp.]|nr:gliding motility-associated C-terminal domain-containing protein [Brumimicrobium sp.]